MKTAVVTGTSYGIGFEVAKKLLNIGYKVYGVSRTETKIDNNNFVWIKCDLYKKEEIENILEFINEEKIDLLVNNAGTHFEENFVDFKLSSFNKMFELNFLSAVYITNLLINKLSLEKIINISSTSDRFVEPGSGLYCASKASLDLFFEALSMEQENIKVIHILPNYVDTPLQRSMKHNDNFDWGQCVSSEKVAEVVIKVANGEIDVATNSKVIVLNNKSLDAVEDPEKLYSYNVDQNVIEKIK